MVEEIRQDGRVILLPFPLFFTIFNFPFIAFPRLRPLSAPVWFYQMQRSAVALDPAA